jgi:hypothetical protein
MSPLGMAHRSWREQRGLTLVGFAKLAGINVGTFGNAYRYGTNIHPTPWRIRAMMSRISMSRHAGLAAPVAVAGDAKEQVVLQ